MKKVLSLVLAGSMVLSLAACGGSKDTASTTDSSAASSAEASGSDTFKIGATGPITGGAAIYGNAVKNGIQIAVDEINEAGGINGYQIDYNFQDDEHDAEKAVNAYNNLKDWGMQVLIGTTTSAPCIAVVEKTHADNMFQITPSGTAVECVQYDNAYRMCFSDPTQGTESAKYIGENGMAQKVAVIYDSSDVYSTGIYEAFAAEAENQPFDIVSVEAFTADAKTDFSVQVQKSKDAGADLLFMPFYYTEASLVLAECNKQGYEPTFFGCDGMDGILGVENFDTRRRPSASMPTLRRPCSCRNPRSDPGLLRPQIRRVTIERPFPPESLSPFLLRIRFQFGRPQRSDNDSRKNTNEIASRT